MAYLIWITGLSGSGKTTIGKEVYRELKQSNNSIVFIDGDHFREIFGNTTGYSKEERLQIAYKITNLCRFLVDQDISVVCCTISLFKEIHTLNRELFQNYYEVYVDCTMDELIRRDQKGIYSAAISGKINNIVGIDIQYDKPINCSLWIDNNNTNDLKEKVNSVISLIKI